MNCAQSVFLWLVKVRPFCCSLWSFRKLILVMMDKWSDDSALWVVHDVQCVRHRSDICCGTLDGGVHPVPFNGVSYL